MMSKDKDPYTVGYGKPPREHQFKKGQSGNPRGRPKKQLSTRPLRQRTSSSIIMEIMSLQQPIQLNGNVQKVALLQAIVLAIARNAIEGKSSAQRIALQLFQQASKELTAEEFSLLEKMKQIETSGLDTTEVNLLKQAIIDSLDESGIDEQEIEHFLELKIALMDINSGE